MTWNRQGYYWCLALLLGVWGVTLVSAANPLSNLFRRVEADPHKNYTVLENNGPWMIMATVCRGDKAEQEAKAIVYELRKDHHLEAYTHLYETDYSKSWQGQHVDRYGKPEMMSFANKETIREVAVLVGNYSTVDDPDALATLKKIKEMRLNSLQNANKDNNSTTTAELEQYRDKVNQLRRRGPMSMAFVSSNPLLPKEYFQQPGLDKFVLDMNNGMRYSLLDCPGKYSVKVATFRGATLLDQKKIKEVAGGKKMKEKLSEAGDKAALLTESLREKGYEAYQFHDRHESVVCIGSFNDVGLKHPDGKIDLDPRIHQIMKVFGATQADPANPGTAAGMHPKVTTVSYGGENLRISLDLQPLPVSVPKRGVAAKLQR
ncbi:MAG: hypothetical protein SFX18_19185 [Pirellulales bacterium]|nr:hypothetical protein [Pirellulales bacterium]